MIISKDSNNNWTPVATGNGQFIGTKAAFDAVKDALPDNTVAYTTDDGESVTDEITNGDMRAVTSNAVYDYLAKSEANATLSASATDGSITCQKSGNVVTVFTSGSQGQVAGSWGVQWATIATIPEGYRPTRIVGGNWGSPRTFNNDNAISFGSGALYITTAGTILAYFPQSLTADGWIDFNVSYVI